MVRNDGSAVGKLGVGYVRGIDYEVILSQNAGGQHDDGSNRNKCRLHSEQKKNSK